MGERFKDKIVIVTGSAGGLGRNFALGFAREGARLVLADVNEAGLKETAAELCAIGAESSVHRVDLAVESDIHAFAAEVARNHPRVDVLINNAGLAYGDIAFEFETLSQAKWLRFFSINTVAPLLLAHALRAPLAVGPGVIINQSSMASYMPGTAYGVTKAALNAMSYGMARSFANQGIRVNSIAPGLMETPANRAGLPPEHYNHIQGLQLLKLHGKPDDITALALFLASDDARFITNEIVHCDAGHPFRGWRG
jgi:NAD(P)-dependent dehydrogenase (short-subunit alcohol dehydrogenase family)